MHVWMAKVTTTFWAKLAIYIWETIRRKYLEISRFTVNKWFTLLKEGDLLQQCIICCSHATSLSRGRGRDTARTIRDCRDWMCVMEGGAARWCCEVVLGGGAETH